MPLHPALPDPTSPRGPVPRHRGAWRRAGWIWAGWFLGALSVLPPLSSAAATSPQRVVSLNLCTDQLVALLLPPERIAALSFLSRDPELSYVADRAQGLPVVRNSAEEILALAPDLVLTGAHTAQSTAALLKARGIPVLEVEMADDFDEVRHQLRQVASALGVPERGAELLAEMDRRLAGAAPTGPAQDRRLRALNLAPGGFTAGAGTQFDAVLRAAGFLNDAAARGLTGYGFLALETVAAHPPDLLIANTEPKEHPSLADRLLKHPVLDRILPAGARVRIPGSLWTCAGPFMAEAVTRLADIRARLLGGAGMEGGPR